MADEVDVVIIGAGFAGMYMLHRCRGLGLTTRVFEAGDGVGGTWYWNRYPGARCDVESLEYSYQFDEALQQEWSWSERYSAQPEILDYANHVADRFDLRSGITFSTRVEGATWDDAHHRWTVTAAAVDDPAHAPETIVSRFVVAATGCLSSTNQPAVPGLDRFGGELYHTGAWPHDPVDFAGKRVGIIGTGSSAVQSIPVIAEAIGADGSLTVFQRTAQYAVPARNRPQDPAYEAEIKADYPRFRTANALMPAGFGSRFRIGDRAALEVTEAEFRAEMERRWDEGGFAFTSGFIDTRLDPDANTLVADFVREKIGDIVTDPETAAKLMPSTTFACKRLCLDTGYFETYNRPNVHLVDISERHGVDEITEAGVVANNESHELDMLIFATGFDAMTGTMLKIDWRGVDGMTLYDEWYAGPRTYLGLGIVGFPNLFTVTGPGSPSVLTNMLVAIQQHVEWITDCIESLDDQGATRIEATADAADAWVAHVNAVADETLYPTCNSWYLGANIPGKPRIFMPLLGFPPYVEVCDAVAADGYRGFAIA
ncbi:MAG: NAD(P)/FAD-dependent oxidoreductase [Actinomycetota bacterium]